MGPVAAASLLGASLAAILLLGWLASHLRLGADVRLRDRHEALALARATACDFDAEEIALDRAGIGALLRGRDGRIMLLRRHGAHFAGRLLTTHQGMRLDRHLLTIATPETSFGAVTLDLGAEAQHWAASLRRLGG